MKMPPSNLPPPAVEDDKVHITERWQFLTEGEYEKWCNDNPRFVRLMTLSADGKTGTVSYSLTLSRN